MDKHELDTKIADIAKTILSYCIARTSNRFEAEDLVQDIILEIYKSADNIRNADAFYGFMWAVAGNVYKQWCKNKSKNKECELTDNLIDVAETFDDDNSELYLLRRELTLLSEKYRKAVILYYIENKSCSEISKHLSISESMVKYLLFKSRQILKEGINMERNYGKQSYNPKGMSLLFWGDISEEYYSLCDSKISQNILFACYNDKLTAEQISLEIGVALPYMEDNLKVLCDYELLKKDGNRYYANIVILTKDFMSEVNSKTIELRKNISLILKNAIEKNKQAVKDLVFSSADINNNLLSWQLVCFILFDAVIENLQKKIKIDYPKDKFGSECFVWAAEDCEENCWKDDFGFWVSASENSNGDYIHFMDFPINGDRINDFFFDKQERVNIFLNIAKKNTKEFSDNDKAIAAEMVRNNYVNAGEGNLFVNMPVFTTQQHEKLREIFSTTCEEIATEGEKMMNTVERIMKNHIPVHLKNLAKSMSYLRLFEDAISAPVAILCDEKYLLPYNNDGILPTTYIVIK